MNLLRTDPLQSSRDDEAAIDECNLEIGGWGPLELQHLQRILQICDEIGYEETVVLSPNRNQEIGRH